MQEVKQATLSSLFAFFSKFQMHEERPCSSCCLKTHFSTALPKPDPPQRFNFFSDQPLDEHDSCVLYWIVCVFLQRRSLLLGDANEIFFLWKKTVQNFCMATFKNVETFITHCPPICSKFAMLLSLFRNKRFVLNKMFQWKGSKLDVFYVL